MRKRVAVAVPVGDGTRDRGEKNYDLYFDDWEISMQSGREVIHHWPLSEVESIDCYCAANPHENNAASNAAVGYVLGGVGGAILGGLLGASEKKSWFIEIKTSHEVRTFRIVLEAHKSVFDKWAKKHNYSIED